VGREGNSRLSTTGLSIGDEVAFDRDLHAYLDRGIRRMSVTQSLVVSGLVDYSMVPAEIMVPAQARGRLVHHATALIDRGENLDDYEVPEIYMGYVEGYHAFQREMKFVPNQDWIERPMIVDLYGHRVGMTPDSVGTIDRVPTLIDRKTSATAHPAWAIQTAGYDLGLRAAGLQIRQRFAVRLTPDGYYKLHPHDDPSDFETFGDCYRMASWKLKHRLATLD
jgi:hypothetical protein